MKPYFVELTVTAVVMAEDADHAWEVADSERRDIFNDTGNVDIYVGSEVTSERNLRDGWDLQCIPYGGDGNTRIGELIGKEKA